MKITLGFIIILILAQLTSIEIISQEYYFISEVTVSGNKRTDLITILRELPFKRGDIVEAPSLDRLLDLGRQNITNLSLFNSVSISKTEPEELSNSKYHNAHINIVVDERWYYWPRVGLRLEERNFSSWIKKPDWENITLETGFTINNIAGRNQTLKVLLTTGFNKGFMFDYSNFSLDKQGKHFLGINFTRLYSRIENVCLKENEPYYLKSDTSFLTSSYTTYLTYTFRQKLRLRHNLILQFSYVDLDPAVLEHNPNYWGSQELRKRGYSIEYDFSLDERDNNQYPLTGYYIYSGIAGYATNRMDTRFFQLKGDYHYYAKLFKRAYISTELQVGLSSSSVQGYIFNKAIGYKDVNLRGYELFVANGQHYFVFLPTFKYNFLPKTYYNLKFLSFLPRFSNIHLALYGKVFSDIGYAWHKYASIENGLSNKMLHSWGVGVDLVSYYDITLSLDFSCNNMGKQGFFFSLITPLR